MIHLTRPHSASDHSPALWLDSLARTVISLTRPHRSSIHSRRTLPRFTRPHCDSLDSPELFLASPPPHSASVHLPALCLDSLACTVMPLTRPHSASIHSPALCLGSFIASICLATFAASHRPKNAKKVAKTGLELAPSLRKSNYTHWAGLGEPDGSRRTSGQWPSAK